MHLTNAAVQKKHPAYKERGQESILSMQGLQEQLEAAGLVPPGWVDQVMARLQHILHSS